MVWQPLPSESTATDEARCTARLNCPNLLSGLRAAASPALVGLVIADRPNMFLALLIVLLLTDWLDGKLAILWNQRTTFGAILDTAADLAMYSALLFGAVWLKWDVLRAESSWLIVAVACYALSAGVGFAKFRRLPSYHTRTAKICWLLTSIAAVSLFAGWSLWPLRIAAAGVTVSNIEAVAITALLGEWRTDVTSVFHVWSDSAKPDQQ